VLMHDNMVIFGGFYMGERSNEIFIYHIKSNSWEKVKVKAGPAPEPRAGHSAVIIYDGAQGD